MVTSACNSLEGGQIRRQRPLGSDTGDRAFVTIRWRKPLRDHPIFTYEPEEFAGAGASHGGQRIYIGAGDGLLYCLDAESGRVIWVTDLGAGISNTPLVVERQGTLFVGAADGALHAVNLKTGRRRWLYRTKGIPFQPAVYSEGVVFFTNHRDQVFSLDARTGRWRWSYDREAPESFTVSGHSGATVSGHNLYVGFADGTLVCLGTRSGEVRWTRSLVGDDREYVDVDATPVVVDGVLYSASFSRGVFALTADGGALRWRFPVRGASSVAVAGERVYFATASRGIHALDLEGRLRWRQHVEAGTPRRPWIRGRAMYLAYSTGGLLVVDRLTGRLVQRFNPGGGISGQPLLTSDSLYLLTNRGSFFAFTLR